MAKTKRYIFIFAAIGLLMIGAYKVRALVGSENDGVRTQSVVTTPASAVTSGSLPDIAGHAQPARRYKDLYSKYSSGSIQNDPIAINQLIDLTGACESVSRVRAGSHPSDEVVRMQKFCAMHASDSSEISRQLNELWPKSYSKILEKKLLEVEKNEGKESAQRELSSELRVADAYQVRIALGYAASSGLVPEELNIIVKDKSDPAVSRQISILSHIEFCRRGGDCANSSFATLSACVALPPCMGNSDLLQVVKQSSTPIDFDKAMRMSQALHSR